MRTLYASVLSIFFFGSFAHAQLKSQMDLTEPDSLIAKELLGLIDNDFNPLDLESLKEQFKPLESVLQQPEGFTPLMPIIKPDNSFEYKMRNLERNDPYYYSMPILEPILLKRFYQS